MVISGYAEYRQDRDATRWGGFGSPERIGIVTTSAVVTVGLWDMRRPFPIRNAAARFLSRDIVVLPEPEHPVIPYEQEIGNANEFQLQMPGFSCRPFLLKGVRIKGTLHGSSVGMYIQTAHLTLGS